MYFCNFKTILINQGLLWNTLKIKVISFKIFSQRDVSCKTFGMGDFSSFPLNWIIDPQRIEIFDQEIILIPSNIWLLIFCFVSQRFFCFKCWRIFVERPFWFLHPHGFWVERGLFLIIYLCSGTGAPAILGRVVNIQSVPVLGHWPAQSKV